jgi:hypothetical protein
VIGRGLSMPSGVRNCSEGACECLRSNVCFTEWVKLAVIQGYRFALDPTPEQDAVLRSHCGGQRYAFNWGWRW